MGEHSTYIPRYPRIKTTLRLRKRVFVKFAEGYEVVERRGNRGPRLGLLRQQPAPDEPQQPQPNAESPQIQMFGPRQFDLVDLALPGVEHGFFQPVDLGQLQELIQRANQYSDIKRDGLHPLFNYLAVETEREFADEVAARLNQFPFIERAYVAPGTHSPRPRSWAPATP